MLFKDYDLNERINSKNSLQLLTMHIHDENFVFKTFLLKRVKFVLCTGDLFASFCEVKPR